MAGPQLCSTSLWQNSCWWKRKHFGAVKKKGLISLPLLAALGMSWWLSWKQREERINDCCKHHSVICTEPLSEKQKRFACQDCKLLKKMLFPTVLIFVEGKVFISLTHPHSHTHTHKHLHTCAYRTAKQSWGVGGSRRKEWDLALKPCVVYKENLCHKCSHSSTFTIIWAAMATQAYPCQNPIQ